MLMMKAWKNLTVYVIWWLIQHVFLPSEENVAKLHGNEQRVCLIWNQDSKVIHSKEHGRDMTKQQQLAYHMWDVYPVLVMWNLGVLPVLEFAYCAALLPCWVSDQSRWWWLKYTTFALWFHSSSICNDVKLSLWPSYLLHSAQAELSFLSYLCCTE